MTEVASTREDLARLRAEAIARAGGRSVAVVMTMGALHAGHAELIRQARRRARVVIVTDFLNPLQFAPGEDLAKYPRTLDADLQLCAAEGVDVFFAPTPDVVYPAGEPMTIVSAGPVGDVLEGNSRPGHFDGVLTVVAKLLHLTGADLAYFGQKDAQQLWLIAQMVKDLDFPVEVVAVPTVRDDDGVALSSRNIYLDGAARAAARSLNQALRAGRKAAEGGASSVSKAARHVLDEQPEIRTDYVELVDPVSFATIGAHGDDDADQPCDALLLLAAFVGTTRLIDNMRIQLGVPPEED
ncbi:MAG TPA: pantoate--beta-alanine ligase [Actinomycetes bacterium]|nr:pantoate--beta-alanine ligase [Actinomycetes bacterium]